MSKKRDLNRLVFHPLFYDLLSGEFKPASDEKNRVHSLGRLMTASYQKGRRDQPTARELAIVAPDGTDELRAYRHSPSWELQVRSNTFCRVRDGLRIATGLILDSTTGTPPLGIFLQPGTTDTPSGVYITEDKLTVELVSGSNLSSARDHLAYVAQNYFDHVHTAHTARS